MDNIKDMSGTIEPATPENTSSFDHFLENWIDNDKLDSYMGWQQSATTFVWIATKVWGMKPIPNLKTLENIMAISSSGHFSEKDKINYCQFKDHLLEYILYVFGYYNYTFEKDGVNIFEKYCPRPKKGIQNPKTIESTEFDSIPTEFKLTAKRIRKIYKIITKYIIGFDDLSDHSVREALKDTNIRTKHRLIFFLGELTEIHEPSLFGIKGQIGTYGGGKYTKRKRIRKTITQKKRASRLSSSL